MSTGPSNLERLEDQWRAAERYHLTTFARVPDIGSSTILRYLDRVCALLEDVAVPENLDAILAVPGVDLYSIRPNDFAQSLGYPGQLDHPEVVKATQEITRRIHQAGRRMQAEVTKSAGVSDMLLEGGTAYFGRKLARALRLVIRFVAQPLCSPGSRCGGKPLPLRGGGIVHLRTAC